MHPARVAGTWSERMAYKTYTMPEARAGLTNIHNAASFGNEITLITLRGKTVAVIPYEMLQHVEKALFNAELDAVQKNLLEGS
jgi:hypothetical protein